MGCSGAIVGHFGALAIMFLRICMRRETRAQCAGIVCVNSFLFISGRWMRSRRTVHEMHLHFIADTNAERSPLWLILWIDRVESDAGLGSAIGSRPAR